MPNTTITHTDDGYRVQVDGLTNEAATHLAANIERWLNSRSSISNNEIINEITNLLTTGDKVGAVHVFRGYIGCGLRDAYSAIVQGTWRKILEQKG